MKCQYEVITVYPRNFSRGFPANTMYNNRSNRTYTGYGQPIPDGFHRRDDFEKRSNLRGKRGNKARSHNRMEEFRRVKSTEYADAYQEEIRKTLLVGVHGEDDALARLGEAQQLRACTLSITTRGIGFGLCQTMFTAITINENIILPSIYSLYRIFLAVAEAKLESLKEDYPLTSRHADITMKYSISSKLQHLAKTVTVAPTPLVKIINAVGIVKKDGAVYLPAVHDTVRNREEEVVPRPENILYSNLRETVVALANEATPVRHRLFFEEHNSIPGAKFLDHILINADEIMPANFDFDDLQREIRIIQPFLIKLQKHVPKLVAGNVDFKTTGSPSLFISNELENLRIPNRGLNQPLQEWYADCIPLGNISTYFSRYDLTAAERFEGQINLLGEIPGNASSRYPLYINRDPDVCPYEISSNYQGLHQILYGT